MNRSWTSIAKLMGWPGLFGTLALLASVGLVLGIGPHMDAQTASVNADIDQLQTARRARLAQGESARKPTSTLDQWRSNLPDASARQERLADLLEQVLRQGLVASRTEHRLSTDAAARLERLRISMPLTGSYSQMHAYIEAALNHDAGLSLDALRLRRPSPQSMELEAEFQWSLHARLNTPNAESAKATP